VRKPTFIFFSLVLTGRSASWQFLSPAPASGLSLPSFPYTRWGIIAGRQKWQHIVTMLFFCIKLPRDNAACNVAKLSILLSSLRFLAAWDARTSGNYDNLYSPLTGRPILLLNRTFCNVVCSHCNLKVGTYARPS